MKKNKTHLGSLIGRVFLISSSTSTENWNGQNDDISQPSDYESLENFVSFNEGDLTSYIKSKNSIFYIYFAISNKVELFTIENGIIICDGLFFNKSWDYNKELEFRLTKQINLNFDVKEEKFYLFDAGLSSDFIFNNLENEINKSIIPIKLHLGKYKVYQVETTLLIEDQEVIVKGVQIAF